MTKATKAVFISDCHLGSVEEPRFVLFLQFLDTLKQDRDLTHLFLVGDIFDLWVGRHSYFIEKYKDLIDRVTVLRDQGVSIHYFEGNHDLYLHDFWGQSLGLNVHDGPELFDFDGVLVRVEHGDEMDPSDRGYRFLRWFLRSWLIRLIIRNLPDWMVLRIGESASKSSREYTSTGGKAQHQEETLAKFTGFAQELAMTQDWTYLIAGHIHIQTQVAVTGTEDRQVFNLGVWGEDPQFLLVQSGASPRFCSIKEQVQSGDSHPN